MKRMHFENWRTRTSISLTSAVGALLLLGLAARSAGQDGKTDAAFDRWLGPQDWRRDSDRPALALGEKGNFDDQHIFAPQVIQQDGEFWMYYCGSQRCVDAGTYKGVAKDPEHPEKSDQRLFKLGLAKSTDGVRFTRVSRDPVFSFGDDIHSVVTAAILKNVDQASGQSRVPAGTEARLGVELHDESHAVEPTRRQLPTLVRRAPPTAVE